MIKETNLVFSTEEMAILDLAKELKLSVSGIKTSRGHDGDCMECNLKIGSKIKAEMWDDSYGGGYNYSGKELKEVELLFDTIIAKHPTVPFLGEPLSLSYDIIVDMMVSAAEYTKLCKKKTVVMATKETDIKKQWHSKETFSYRTKIGENGLTREKIFNEFEKEGYIAVQILDDVFAA